MINSSSLINFRSHYSFSNEAKIQLKILIVKKSCESRRRSLYPSLPLSLSLVGFFKSSICVYYTFIIKNSHETIRSNYSSRINLFRNIYSYDHPPLCASGTAVSTIVELIYVRHQNHVAQCDSIASFFSLAFYLFFFYFQSRRGPIDRSIATSCPNRPA